MIGDDPHLPPPAFHNGPHPGDENEAENRAGPPGAREVSVDLVALLINARAGRTPAPTPTSAYSGDQRRSAASDDTGRSSTGPADHPDHHDHRVLRSNETSRAETSRAETSRDGRCGGAEPAGPPGYVAWTAPGPQDPPVARGNPDPLSARELQVVRLVAEGTSNREIAELLGLSALTIKSHLARIARKLRARDRAHIVAQALRAGFIS